MDDAKWLTCDRVNVTLAKEANIVSVLKLRQVCGVISRLTIVEADCARILHASVIKLVLFVALEILGYAGRGNGKTDQDESDQKENSEEDVSAF